MAVNCGTRYALPCVRIFWVRSASSTYMKYFSSNPPTARKVRVRTAELEASNRELEAFSYSVSHDLRAPLRAIDGFAQIVAEDYAPRLDETGREYLQRIRVAT